MVGSELLGVEVSQGGPREAGASGDEILCALWGRCLSCAMATAGSASCFLSPV